MRIILTLVAAQMLQWPYLKVVGALLLLYIGIQLLGDEEDETGEAHHKQATLMSAVRTILVADLVMSLDNVIAIAGAAQGAQGVGCRLRHARARRPSCATMARAASSRPNE